MSDKQQPSVVARASVRPSQTMDLLTQREMASLATTDQEVHHLFRRCALAVLNSGDISDNADEIFRQYADFEVQVVPESRGLKLELRNAPACAFVDGKMIEGIRVHLFSALRDIVFTHHKLVREQRFDLASGEGITDAVFRILRNAEVVRSNVEPSLVVCWGGHSIPRHEYDFTKQVGYELGLRGLDIVTGCGPGAMKGPMKGAAIGHAKQLNRASRFVGLSEPDIIAAEAPNPIVNELVVMPDIEKRLEGFLRIAHGIIVFPGGVGTMEEILYLLGVATHPDNAGIPVPVVFAAPRASADYFAMVDRFLRSVLGEEAGRYYEIIVDDAPAIARHLKKQIKKVRRHRVERSESFSFNWELAIPPALQRPFLPNHENMAALQLRRSAGTHTLLTDLRRAFSGIVAGNVKAFGIQAVAERGPFLLQGDPDLVAELTVLLEAFVASGRMKLDARSYRPCFRLADL